MNRRNQNLSQEREREEEDEEEEKEEESEEEDEEGVSRERIPNLIPDPEETGIEGSTTTPTPQNRPQRVRRSSLFEPLPSRKIFSRDYITYLTGMTPIDDSTSMENVKKQVLKALKNIMNMSQVRIDRRINYNGFLDFIKKTNFPYYTSTSNVFFDGRGKPQTTFDVIKFYNDANYDLEMFMGLSPNDIPRFGDLLDNKNVFNVEGINVFLIDTCTGFFSRDKSWQIYIRDRSIKNLNKKSSGAIDEIKTKLINYFNAMKRDYDNPNEIQQQVTQILTPLFILPDESDYSKYREYNLGIIELTINELSKQSHNFLIPPTHEQFQNALHPMIQELLNTYLHTKSPLIAIMSRLNQSSLQDFLQKSFRYVDNIVRQLDANSNSPSFRDYVITPIENYKRKFDSDRYPVTINNDLSPLVSSYLTATRTLKLALFWIFKFEVYLERYILASYSGDFSDIERKLADDKKYIICLDAMAYFWKLVNNSIVLVSMCAILIKYQVILLDDLEEIETAINSFYRTTKIK